MMIPPQIREISRWSGLRVGLLGGSFNPPHRGHIHASEIALKYLGLDAIWWLVSPQNPLKSSLNVPSLSMRVENCRALVKNPSILISDIEKDLGTTRTYDTIRALKLRFPRTEFIWCAGLDVAQEFHRWYRWRDLPKEIPFAFVGRPTTGGATRKTALQKHGRFQNINLHHGGSPSIKKGQIYWIIEEKLNPLSSTLLRVQSDDLLYDAHQGKIEDVRRHLPENCERSV